MHSEKKNGNINDVVLKVTSGIKFITDHKEIKIKKNLNKDIPEFSFDSSQMEEVISNIVTNAIQAIPKKGTVNISTISEDSKIIVEISDNGNGIAKENLSKIFMPFYSSKEYGKGTGLGLSIAKRMINEHNGEILVESKVGKGTKFRLVFPVSK